MKMINNGTDPLWEAMRNELPDAFRTGRVSYNPVYFTEFSPLPDMYGEGRPGSPFPAIRIGARHYQQRTIA